jgi:hypothetical protein
LHEDKRHEGASLRSKGLPTLRKSAVETNRSLDMPATTSKSITSGTLVHVPPLK